MTSRDYSEFSTVKYEIIAKFSIDGVVEKSDVVGAIFGQTEGLLGEELDIRELQKSGRIGRIQVEMESNEGKTTGKVMIPSSLDRVETAILAATVETVDRVGPCIAKFDIETLQDVRKLKRDKIINRATQLLQRWELEVSPETQEITEKVNEARLSEDIVHYGEEKLPAGPEVDTDSTIIVCEGRADVLNLLGIGIKNAIATNGTKVPKTIAELSKKKTTIAFLDGDRGGDMILKELLQVGKIDFVARAPQGKEVEDLTKKELLKALQSKVAYVNNKPLTSLTFNSSQEETLEPKKETNHKRSQKQKTQKKKKITKKSGDKKQGARPKKVKPQQPSINSIPEIIRESSSSVLGTTKARFYDAELNIIKEVPTSLIIDELQKTGGKVEHILFDGIISQRLLDISANENVKTIIGTRIGNVFKPDGIKIFCIEDII
ncbi:MAG: DNA primase DnaG [Promethearchaeota archaeon]